MCFTNLGWQYHRKSITNNLGGVLFFISFSLQRTVYSSVHTRQRLHYRHHHATRLPDNQLPRFHYSLLTIYHLLLTTYYFPFALTIYQSPDCLPTPHYYYYPYRGLKLLAGFINAASIAG